MRRALALLLMLAAPVAATASYTVILPPSYSPAHKWPVLLVLDPRGRGAMAAEIFRAPAEELGWIVLSSNDTRSDAGWDVNIRALDELRGDLPKYAVDPARIYAAGFSGTASVAWVLAKSANLAGVINAGQPYQDNLDPAHVPFAVWSSAGVHDFNHMHVKRIDAEASRSGKPHRLEIFDGAHEWMPPALARAAMEWHELHATRDDEFIARVFRNEMERAAQSSDELVALRHYEAIGRDFEGLHETAEPARLAASLRASPRVKKLIRDERSAEAYEKRELDAVIARLREVLAAELPPEAAVRAMRLGALQKEAAEPSYRGAAATRVLATLFTQCAFYLPQRYAESKELEKANVVRAIASAIKRH